MRHWAFGRCQVYVALRCGRCGPVSPVPPPTTPSRTRCLHRRLARAARTCGLAAVAWPNRVNTGGDPSHGVNRLQWRAARGVALRTAGFAAAARRLPPTAHGRHALWTRCVRHEQKRLDERSRRGRPTLEAGSQCFAPPLGRGAHERWGSGALICAVSSTLAHAGLSLARRMLSRRRSRVFYELRGRSQREASRESAREMGIFRVLCAALEELPGAGPHSCVPVCPSADAGCCHARPDSRPP